MHSEEDVVGLDVQVDHPAFVGGDDCVGDLDQRLDLGTEVALALFVLEGEVFAPGRSGDQLHDQTEPAFPLNQVVNREDVGMAESCGDPRFVGEPPLQVEPAVRPHELDCDLSMQGRLLRLPHLTHAARPNELSEDDPLGRRGEGSRLRPDLVREEGVVGKTVCTHQGSKHVHDRVV